MGSLDLQKKPHGYLEIILGPMFSGKTSSLIKIYNTEILNGKRVVVINHSSDTRYSKTLLSTHDKQMIPCDFISDLKDAWRNEASPFNVNLRQADIILINEAQFFPDLKEIVLEMVELYYRHVVICGLDGDFKRKPFGEILDLIPYCDSVKKLSAICNVCINGTLAIFTNRISSEESQIVIGSDNYQPLCRNCYTKNSFYKQYK